MALNILITGGAGFIGSHTADALILDGHRVRILDNLQKNIHPRGKPDYIHPEAEFVLGDVRDKGIWQTALQGIDVIYHFAAYQDYLTDFSTFFHVNAVSTALLYEVLIENSWASRIKKVIVAASQAVMGEGKYKCPGCYETDPNFIFPQIRTEAQLSKGDWEHRCPECNRLLQWLPSDESVVNPCNQYALSKHSQEQIAIQLGRQYQIPTTVLRYSIVQGPRQSFYNAYSGVMRIFALSLLQDKQPVIFEDGRQVRDFINIYDVVDANLTVLYQKASDFGIFNVGGQKAWTVSQFYDTMQQVLNKRKDPLISGYYRFGDTRHIFSDTGRLSKLGWSPTRDIKTSIIDYWHYIKDRKEGVHSLESADEVMKKKAVIRKVKINEKGLL